MEFRLIYEGPLLGQSARSPHKWEIRRALHPQLKRLWQQQPLVNVAESVGSLLLLALVAWLNFYGLCLRALLAGALGTALLFVWRPIRVRPTWNAAHLKHLLKIGLPIFGVGQLYA